MPIMGLDSITTFSEDDFEVLEDWLVHRSFAAPPRSVITARVPQFARRYSTAAGPKRLKRGSGGLRDGLALPL